MFKCMLTISQSNAREVDESQSSVGTKMSVLHPRGKRHLRADTFNRNFICKICEGYLIRPVAITECLHTFCRSCLVKYLENANDFNCPDCGRQIHETNPWEYLREDKTLEDIIFKLVPGLWKSERCRRVQFYSLRGTNNMRPFLKFAVYTAGKFIF